MDVALRLLEGEHERQAWGLDGRDAALEAFWSSVASLSTWDEPRPWRWSLELVGARVYTLKDVPLAEAAVYAVRTRWNEPGFRAALVHRTARQLAWPAFDLAELLDVPPTLSPPVSTVAGVLMRCFSVPPPRHLGHEAHPFPRREGDRLCVTHRSDVHPNGAGTITYTDDWVFTLVDPALAISGQCTSEQGTTEGWWWNLTAPLGFSSQPLQDGLREQGVVVGGR
ncbi:MAG: hypothetical protein U0228_15280 [Myxococcaceae bacterium]